MLKKGIKTCLTAYHGKFDNNVLVIKGFSAGFVLMWGEECIDSTQGVYRHKETWLPKSY